MATIFIAIINLLLTIINANEVTAFDTDGTDSDNYYVITLYNVGNSSPSNVASITPTAINNISLENSTEKTTSIYTTSGVRVGNNISILPAGLYIVKQGNKIHKVIVK